MTHITTIIRFPPSLSKPWSAPANNKVITIQSKHSRILAVTNMRGRRETNHSHDVRYIKIASDSFRVVFESFPSRFRVVSESFPSLFRAVSASCPSHATERRPSIATARPGPIPTHPSQVCSSSESLRSPCPSQQLSESHTQAAPASESILQYFWVVPG